MFPSSSRLAAPRSFGASWASADMADKRSNSAHGVGEPRGVAEGRGWQGKSLTSAVKVLFIGAPPEALICASFDLEARRLAPLSSSSAGVRFFSSGFWWLLLTRYERRDRRL